MPTTQNVSKTLPPDLAVEMEGYYYSVNLTKTGEKVWTNVFTEAERQKLGRSFTEAFKSFHGLTGMWVKVRGGTPSRAIVEILSALELIGPRKRLALLQQLGEEGEDADASMELAIQSGCLVLSDAPRQAYWKTKLIKVDWDRNAKLWEYLLAVCKASKRGDRLDHLIYGSSPRALKDHKSRLLEQAGFPKTLAHRFGTRAKANQLDLKPQEIRIFERVFQEDRSEWRP